jgi:hypothetical protein
LSTPKTKRTGITQKKKKLDMNRRFSKESWGSKEEDDKMFHKLREEEKESKRKKERAKKSGESFLRGWLGCKLKEKKAIHIKGVGLGLVWVSDPI